ncbi:methyltransferase domain-containing protein [Pseudoxanthobacter sp.]|uniref:class I SAM-dependent methyltransferase n=1 Tax=Pseudoxanthobacter sp. TaxID=1925742 RepID=UPI002FDF5F5B
MTDTPVLFDRALLARRRRAALARGSVPDFLTGIAVEDLAVRLAGISRHFPVALDLGSGGAVAQLLRATGKADHAVVADVLAAGPGAEMVVDDEALPFAAESLDLVVSTLSLQAVNDLPGALVQIRRMLRPDGLLLATLPGGDTLAELRDSLISAESELTGGASPRVAPFADLRTLAGLLQRAGFALPVADTDRFTVRYDHMFALIADLRAAGATNVLVDRSRRPLSRAVLARAAEIYAERHADADGRIRATVEMISLSGWAPHESQQKPLKPGSARMRLADALGAIEQSTGEKAGH